MFSCPSCPKSVAAVILRVSFGFSLFFVGVAHYINVDGLRLMVIEGFDAVPALGAIAGLWAFIMPGLMVVGGGLFVTGRFNLIAAWCSGIALGSIPAGMLLKPLLLAVGLEDMMPAATNALIWLLVYAWVVKLASCDGKDCKK